MSKPASKPGWIPSDNPAYIEDPGSTKTNGWVDNTPAPNLQFNWFWNLTSQWINFVDEITQAAAGGLNVVEDGSILFNGSSYDAEISLNTAGTEMLVLPKTDNQTDLYIGTATYTWKDMYIQAEGDMSIVGATIAITGATGSVDITSNGNMEIIPGTDDTHNIYIGTSSYTWDNIYIQAATLARIIGASVDIDATGAAEFDSGTTMEIDAGTTLDIDAGTSMTIDAGSTIDITSIGALTTISGANTVFKSDTTDTDNCYIGTGTVKWLNITLNASADIDLNSGAGINIGGTTDITLQATEIDIDTADIVLTVTTAIRPDNDDEQDLDIGETAKRYQYVKIKAVDAISFADGDSYGCQANFTNDAFQPIDSGETWDLGTSTYGWDVVYRVSEATPSELYFADSWKNPKTGEIIELNDLELLCNIKGRGSHDERQGFELVDDDTLPNCILFRNKETGEIEYNKKGQPFSDVDALTALCIGAIRQLKSEIDNLKKEKI